MKAADHLREHGRLDTVVVQSKNLPMHESAFVSPKRKTDEYVYDTSERADIKNKKTMQRQLNFMTMVNNNPIIVGANPKILSMDGIPALEFMDQQTFGKDSFQRKKHGKFGVAEERMVRYKAVDYETTLNSMNIKAIKKTYADLKCEKTKSYDLDKKRMKKRENPRQNNQLKKLRKEIDAQKIKYDDFKRCYCNVDEELKKTQTLKFQDSVRQDMENYKRVNTVAEDSSDQRSYSALGSQGEQEELLENSLSREDESSIEDENEAAAGDYDIKLLSKTLKRQ